MHPEPAMLPDRPDVSVVIVSYNTREDLRGCLAALLAAEAPALEVFVVDNGSRDGSPEMVADSFARVRLIRSADNRGFAAANNLAIRQARGRYVLLLNPDTLVRPDTVALLSSFLDGHADTGIVGPMVLNGDGSLQSCGYQYPSVAGEVRQSKNIGRVLRGFLGSEPEPSLPEGPRAVDWVDGCCLMIRRTVIDQIGLLDEQFFLYAEELDWCRSAREAGWEVMVNPAAVMTHLRGKSSDQVREASLALLVETKLRYFRKHEGLLTALGLSVVYALGFLKQWRHEPVKNRAKMQGVVGWWRGLVRP